MKNNLLGFLRKKETSLKTDHHLVELSNEEMMGVEGASSEYLAHFYEQDKIKGLFDPIYQKVL
ncbi:hypothetical protein HU147_01440 [Planomicrobium chinense]|uniref:hypothetical protein n=1 Tax=Planococcus chinensis TaxID=272917 RepID=UPI001CC6AC8E|nr:hypothetical protein [Planococcus chinensis]MBZ5199865.1 hypothetical protein [Planococcus chinensis]